MPELPEVETIRGQLEPRLTGRRIAEAGSHPSAKFAPAVEAAGREISGVARRGKYLIIPFDDAPEHGQHGQDGQNGRDRQNDQDRLHGRDRQNGRDGLEDDRSGRPMEMVVHLGMTGRLSTRSSPDLGHPHLRAWWRLDDGTTLTFHDIRRFGRIRLVEAGRYEDIATLHRLGPEPFSREFTGDSLWRALRASSRRVKTQLLSQRPVAGVGNIYADEALWLAGVNPVVRRLSRERAGRLASAIRTALASGLRHGGTTLRDYVTAEGASGRNQHHLRCYGRAGEPCERCGAGLRRRVVDARGTTWCPTCQRR